MKNDLLEIINYYDKELVCMIKEKYNTTSMDAFKNFIKSETYKMLNNEKMEMWDFGPKAIFDMYENEKITGNPRNSVYLRN